MVPLGLATTIARAPPRPAPGPPIAQGAEPSADIASDEDTKAVASFWERLRSIEPRRMELVPPTEEYELNDYWFDLGKACGDEFKKLISEGDLDSRMEGFVNGFGRHGPEVDLRWAMCCSSTFTVSTAEPKWEPEDWGALWHKMNRLNESVCQALVKRMLRDQDFLSRYLQLVLWCGLLHRGGEHDGLSGKDLEVNIRNIDTYRTRFGDQVTWYVRRNTILLFFVTGRHDLLEEATPEDIDARYPRWRDWLDKNFLLLQPADHRLSWEKKPEEGFRRQFGPIPAEITFFKGSRVIPLLPPPEAPFPDNAEWVKCSPDVIAYFIDQHAVGMLPIRDEEK